MQDPASVPLIPREELFGNPEKVLPRLSPDGTRLAYVAPDEGVLNVWVRTVGAKDDCAITRDRRRGVQHYVWAENGEQILYVQDRDGDENWHLFAVPALGGDPTDLTPVEGVQARILGLERNHPDSVLVGLNDRDPQLHDVYRVDLRSGQRTLEVRNDIGAVDWAADHDLVVRAAAVPTPDGGFRFLQRAGAEAEWQEFFSVDNEDALGTHLLQFAGDNRTLYLLTSRDANATELRAFDTATGESRTLASDPVYDIGAILRDPKTHEVQAAIVQKERQHYEVFDPSVRDDLERLHALHHGDVHLMGRDREDRHWLVAHVQDLGPVVYHAWDRARKQARFLFSARPSLERYRLASTRPVSYDARDGLTIHGYLTLPAGTEPRNLPAVLLVHGGPWHRDVWGYDALVQWLANRGYACLQVNFRGSTGFGKKHLNAGDREWGGKMQDDVTDGVAWLVDQGIADPGRVGIFGGSYGGYAVLCGLTRTPERFACGIDLVGPSNLITFIRTIPPYWVPLRRMFTRRVGDLETEEEFLRSRSPLFFVDRIRAPLLIVQGRNDPRVKREESLQIVEALEKSGKPVEYLEFEDEGHGLERPHNRLRFMAAAERFLAEHLGGRCEPEEERTG